MRIPFDSLTLAAVVAECRQLEGAKVQKVVQPDAATIVLDLYGAAGHAMLLICCDPVFYRAHLTTRKPGTSQVGQGMCEALRAHLAGARVRQVEQVGFDRVMRVTFEGADGPRTLVAEFIGAQSNVALLGSNGRAVAVMRHGHGKASSQRLGEGKTYVGPTSPGARSVLEVEEVGDLSGTSGASPFLIKLIEATAAARATPRNAVLGDLRDRLAAGRFAPVIAYGHGAYPVDVEVLGLESQGRPSISVALEQHYAEAVPRSRAEQLRLTLHGQLQRVIVAREAALGKLQQAADAATQATDLQRRAELLLAFGPTLEPGSSVVTLQDMDGRDVPIPLDPDLGYLENAQRMFAKAKRAKSGQGFVLDQMSRLRDDKAALVEALARLATAEGLAAVEAIQEEATRRKWLSRPLPASHGKAIQPYEGHKIREAMGPGGKRILFGENATANDYLTTRVAKPMDIWLHVRGSASAHVVIVTERHPERIGPEVLAFAAKIAVANSPSKHSRLVPVDWTFKKHVRKPRGSAPGLATYTHEKTLHVE